MTLSILNNGNAATVANHLKAICPDPALAIDLAQHADGNWGNGAVSFQPAPTTSSVGCQMVQDLVNSAVSIGIRGENDAWSVAPLANRTLNYVGGVTVKDIYPAPTLIEIVYDVDLCSGQMLTVRDAAGNHIQATFDEVLFHEMAHARDLINGTFNAANPEPSAIAQENSYRASRGLQGARAGHGGGCDAPPAAAAPPAGSSKCFIATAAFGSPIEPEVQFLRSFRDDILRQTRSGEEFFQRYWSHYYRVSPQLVKAMETDQNVKDIVRWSVVTPIVRYLELLIAFPDASPESLPEPWSSFLFKLQKELEAWTADIRVPNTYRDIDAVAAAQELSIILRYVLRSPRRRLTYLEHLEAAGEIPLRGSPNELQRAAGRLRENGVSEEEIDRILASAHKPQDSSCACFMNAGEVFDAGTIGTGEWVYQVVLTNLTGQSWQQAVVFYNQNGNPNVYVAAQNNIQAGQVVRFELGRCGDLDSYNVGIFDYSNNLVGQIPDPNNPIFQGAPSMTPALDHQIHPTDPPCVSGWMVS